MRIIGTGRHWAPEYISRGWLRAALTPARYAVKTAEAWSYRRWLERVEPSAAALAASCRDITVGTLVSIVVPVYKPDLQTLEAAIESIRGQTYGHWELCLSNDGSDDPEVLEFLNSCAGRDERVRVHHRARNGGISAATNDAIAMTRGEYIAFMDQDDLLAPWALQFVVAALRSTPDSRMVYSDEDKIDQWGRRCNPHLKSDWDPILIQTNNYVCHFLVMQAALIRELGGLRSTFDGAQDFDLVLRASQMLESSQIVHVPAILYHWRASPGSTAGSADAKPYAHQAGKLAVEQFMGDGAKVVHDGPAPFTYLPELRLPEPRPSMTIALICQSSGEIARESIQRLTDMDARFGELVAFKPTDNQPRGAHLSPRPRILSRDPAEPASVTFERVLGSTNSDLVLLLAEDVILGSIDDAWRLAARLLGSHLLGAVGPRILREGGDVTYPDTLLPTVAHSGRRRTLRFSRQDQMGHGARLLVPHSTSALSTECLMIRTDALRNISFPEDLQGQDALGVAIGMHLRSQGWGCAYEPLVEVMSTKAGRSNHQRGCSRSDLHTLSRRWGNALYQNPYYNRSLARNPVDYSLSADAPSVISWLQDLQQS